MRPPQLIALTQAHSRNTDERSTKRIIRWHWDRNYFVARDSICVIPHILAYHNRPITPGFVERHVLVCAALPQVHSNAGGDSFREQHRF
jgi:hypothetical protein